MKLKWLLPVLVAVVAVLAIAQFVWAAPPTPVITSPTDGATVGDKVNVTGTAAGPDFNYYKVEYKGEAGKVWIWVDGKVHTTPVENGTLATWDTNNLADGKYGLRVLAADKSGQYNTTEIQVTVSNAAAKAQANAPRRGCYACHVQIAPDGRYTLAYEAEERMQAQGKQHPELPEGFKTPYETCVTCHSESGPKPFSSILHPAHMFSSNIFIGVYKGNCFTCHEVKEGKFTVLVEKQYVNDKGVIEPNPAAQKPAAPAAGSESKPASATTTQASAGGPPNVPANHPAAGCLVCHSTGAAGAPKFPANHTAFTEAQCSTCHKPK